MPLLTTSEVLDDLAFAFELKKFAENQKLLFCYHGVFTEVVVKHILSLSEPIFEEEQLSPITRRKVQALMVEVLQNLIRHNSALLDKTQRSVFIMTGESNRFSLISGNYISSSQALEVETRIEAINTLPLDEVRQSYLNQASLMQVSSKGGAGLGLLDMARKSGNKIEYNLRLVDEDVYFFVLKTSLNV